MAYTLISTVQWGSSPKIPLTFYYDYQRSGSDMQYRIKIAVGGVSGQSYFGYPIYATLSLDGTTVVSGHTIKSASPSQWSSGAYDYETGWFTVSGKASGTTALTIRMYSGGGSSRDTSYGYSLYVSPAATEPTLSVAAADMGAAVTISLPRASSSFTHKLWYRPVGGAWAVIEDGVGTSYRWTVPDLASTIPNATSLVLEVDVETFEAGAKIGEKSTYLTANVPVSVVPTISSVTISEGTSGLANQFGTYVQNKSTLAVSVTAAGAKGSTVSRYEATVLGIKYTGATFRTQPLTDSGNVTVVVTVTDSRGRTTTKTQTVAVLEYFAPKINSFAAWRIDTAGKASEDGPRIAVSLNTSIAPVGNKNSRTVQLQYCRSGADTFTTFRTLTPDWEHSGNLTFTSAPEISTDYAYIIRLVVRDYFGTGATQDVEVPTAFVVLDFRSTGRGVAIGKVSEQDKLEVAMDVEFTGGVSVGGKVLLDLLHPVGSIYQSTVETDPGTLFGGTWERIKDRFLLAAGDTFAAGKTGGESEVTLTANEIPEIKMGYQYTGQSTVIGTDAIRLYDANGQLNQYTGPQSSNCGGKAHNNMPPYLAVYVWRRTA